ncbi:MAG: hypothetical protein ACRD8A_15015 [Candidatus Acidiferrales bacterium]
MVRFCVLRTRSFSACLLALACVFIALSARAQGPSPETAAPLFPGGALVSYGPTFTTRGLFARPGTIPATARPTFSYDGDFYFTWGFLPNCDLEVVAPLVTNHFDFVGGAPPGAEGTGFGDVLALMKYRFYRKDSARGTSQLSVTFGPKLPTGSTDLTDASGALFPAGLQPGSGSTDLFLGANWTYTGLLNVRRLVADEDFHSLLRTTGTQETRLGDEISSRFWLSYRPYESKYASRDWFIGPALTWLHSQNDRVQHIDQPGSGGDALLAGITTYVDARPGLDVWVGVDWDVAHSSGIAYMPVRRSISFGITQQFRLHF